MNEEREMILRMLKEGKISIEEADALLRALTEGGPGEAQARSVPPSPPESEFATGLREMITELTTTVPREVMREVRRAQETWGPDFSRVVEGLWGLAEGQATANFEESMTAGETFAVQNVWGDLALAVSSDDRLRVKAYKRVWASTADEAADLADRLPISLSRDGAVLRLVIPRLPERRVRVDLELAVPRQVGVSLELAKGDVRASGLHGRLGVHLARGNTQVTDHEGPFQAGVAHGSVRAERITGEGQIEVKHGDVTMLKLVGPTAIRTMHGDISCEECSSDLSLEAIHGNVMVSRAAGKLSIEGKHGQIDLRFIRGQSVDVRTKHGNIILSLAELAAAGVIDVGTVRGNIEVILPADAHASIDAAVRAGRIRSAVPLGDEVGDRFRLRGVFNSAGATVTLRATSGNIDIRAATA